MNAKLILSALGLVAMLVTPAMAQKTHKRSVVPSSTVVAEPGYGIAQRGDVQIGTDPDPSIRSELHRDFPTALGAN
jgi:hypothetical protein